MIDYGRVAELKTAIYFRKKGYDIVEHNFRSRFGEIDLIVADEKYLVFVEVKLRSEKSIAKPREFVDSFKQRKIISTANMYLASNKTNLQPRFDVVEIYLKDNKIKSIKHLENAFSLV